MNHFVIRSSNLSGGSSYSMNMANSKKNNESTEKDIDTFLNEYPSTKLNDVEQETLEGLIQEDEALKAIQEFKNNKSPGVDGITIEFYKKNVG